MRRPDEVLSRLHLLEHAWDFAYENRSNVIDVYIRHLRNKIDDLRQATRWRPSGEPATGCAGTAAFDATADPPARVGRVRCRDGGRARPFRRHPLRPLGFAPVATRSTASCACARTIWPCSSAGPARRSRPSSAVASSRRARPTRRCSTRAAGCWTDGAARSQSAADRRRAATGLRGRDLHEPRLGAGPRRALAHLRHARHTAWAEPRARRRDRRVRIAPRRCAACATSYWSRGRSR